MYAHRKPGMALVMLLSHSLFCATLVACHTDDVLGGVQSESTEVRRAAQTQAIVTWNVIALQTAATGPFSPPRESRAMAMVSAAVFDAVTSITQDHSPYALHVVTSRSASIEAAVTAAAHGVLVALFPGATASLNAARDSALALLMAGRARDDGVAAGQGVAAAVVAMRTSDHATIPPSYTPGSGVGAWVPTPPGFVAALEPAWGKVAPFFMDSGSQFRPGPPPAIGSEAYVRDYVEMMSIGASNSQARSAAATEASRFWITTAAQLWNQVVRQAVVGGAPRLEAAEVARAFLLLNGVGADAMIAAWDAKYFYNQWRPITAIRSTVDDGNAATLTDTTWTPLITTPPFPDYPAGHTAYGGAAERVLTALFGDKPGALSISSPALSGLSHQYQSFSDIAEEVTNARVWGGVHWRTSSTAGTKLGRSIADFALTRAPKRLN